MVVLLMDKCRGYEDNQFTMDIGINERMIQLIFKECSDVIIRKIPYDPPYDLLIVYIDGLSDVKTLDQSVLEKLLYDGLPQGTGRIKKMRDVLQKHLIPIANTKTVSTIQEAENSVLQGNVLLLTQGSRDALIAELRQQNGRNVEEPAAETTIRGPREGFTETLRVNIVLLRRKIHNSRLKFETTFVGDVTKTNVTVAYIEGIVNMDVLHKVKERTSRIKIDGVLESGNIEEFIEDNPFSVFPQIQNTERPDVVAAALLQGKVAILVDGTPFVLIVPCTFWAGVHAAEDQYERFIYTSAIRVIRMILIVISLLFPSVYVAVVTFHPQLLPTSLIFSFAAAREPSPFPTVIEAFMMEFLFEALREAGVRLPRPVGSTISIVGALVIGQAAVQAGIISAPLVIVVSTTGIASFAIPRYSFSAPFRLLRFALLFLSGTLGLYGITLGLLAILGHLVMLESFGVPYLSPIAPSVKRHRLAAILRVPSWRRPRSKILRRDKI